jgi:hypothetical protein
MTLFHFPGYLRWYSRWNIRANLKKKWAFLPTFTGKPPEGQNLSHNVSHFARIEDRSIRSKVPANMFNRFYSSTANPVKAGKRQLFK